MNWIKKKLYSFADHVMDRFMVKYFEQLKNFNGQNEKINSHMKQEIYEAIKEFYYNELPFSAREMQNSKEHQEVSRWEMEDFNPKYNPYILLKQKAAAETVEFIESNIQNAQIVTMTTWKEKYKFVEYLVGLVPEQAFIVECGVYQGASINFMADKRPKAKLYGFDSFEGLPDNWSGYTMGKGHFVLDRLPDVRNNVQLIKGWFDETLPKFADEHKKEKIDLLNIDSDIYSSAISVLEGLKGMIAEDTIISFDEFFNYPGWKNHEYKAFQEFCKKYSVEYEYIAIGNSQAAVRIKKINFGQI